MTDETEKATNLASAMAMRDVAPMELCRALQVSPQVVNNWLSRGVSKAKLLSVADFLQVDPRSLDPDYVAPAWTTGYAPHVSEKIRAYGEDDPVKEDEVRIRESRIAFSAGPGRKPTFELIEDSEPASYRRSWFQKERMRPERCIRFRVTNDSQEPFLFSGDTILVNLDETEIRDGRTYAIRYGDELRVKKLYKRATGLVLESWNDKLYPPEFLTPAEADTHITVIGRVRDKSGRGGL